MRKDGLLDIVGRRDRQVKIAGVRIELGDVEARLLATGRLEEAAVLAFEYSSGEKFLHAFVVPRGDLDLPRLRSQLADSLARIALPRGFTVLDMLPRTRAGKVDFSALEAPDAPRHTPSADALSHADDVAALLAAIWREVLRVDDISGDDHFLKLGGNSLSAVMVAARLRVALHVDVPLRMLLEFPVFDDQAKRLEAITLKASRETV